MVYLDYSATTYVDKKILKNMKKNIALCGANPNSKHDVGLKAKELIDNSTEKICKYLNIKTDELIYTSGASESNNTIIKGVVENYKIKKIITTRLEHSSIVAPVAYLQQKGVEVEFCEMKDGIVDIDKLMKQIGTEPTLVSICAVNSELGLRQPVEEIGLELQAKSNVIFHSDITQAIGKVKVDLTNIDLASFSGHKIYTFKGIGGLYKNEKTKFVPLIHGGKSTTNYRSGTPQTELIASLSDAFDLVMPDIDKNLEYVKSLNNKIKDGIKDYPDIVINSTEESIPHILNMSILGRSSDDTQDYFNKKGIYISTKTACAADSDLSLNVKYVTGDDDRAKSSIRISLSYKTTKRDVDMFLQVLKQYMEEYQNEVN